MLVAKNNYLNDYEYERNYGKKSSYNKNKAVKKKKNNSPAVLRSLMCIGTLFAIGFLIMVRHVMLADMTNKIDKQKIQISSLEKTNSQMKSDLYIDLNAVEDVAKNKLGMERPYDYQLVYVDLNKESNNTNQVASTGGLNIVGKINNIVSYLY